ncbi:MAG: TlpA family protein disulfide reductase [Bacteroidota bacterium]
MDVSTKQVRIAVIGLALALAFCGGVLVAYLGSDGRLSYTEPRGNPSLSPSHDTGDFAIADAAQRRSAPGFAFADGDGQPLRLADFHGRVVLVNLWATWCPPCIAEMPDLNTVQQRLGGDQFQVVAVSLDRGGIDHVKRWFERNEIHALGAYVADANQFGNAVLPTSLLLDKQGRVAWHGAGLRDWAGADAQAAIQAVLAE